MKTYEPALPKPDRFELAERKMNIQREIESLEAQLSEVEAELKKL
jgi:hypothetical protein